jgi:hypothetical protein
MTFRIEIEANELTETEARGLVALFRELHPGIASAWPASDEPDLFTPTAVIRRADGSTFRPSPDTLVGNALAAGGPGATIGVSLGDAGTLDVDTPNDPATVFGDPAALYQALGGTLPADPVTPAEAFGDPSFTGAPSVVAPVPAVAPAPVDLDRHGLPYDARIHSTPAKKNADLSWRAKRGVSNETVATVEAELRQLMAASGGPPPVSPPAPSPTVPSPPPASIAAPPPGSPSATVPTPPTPSAAAAGPGPAATTVASPSDVPAAPTAQAPTGAQLFAALMRRVNASQNRADNPLTKEQTDEALQACELTKLPDFIRRPDLIPVFESVLEDRLAPAPAA